MGKMEELEKLAKLKENGIINETEFEVEKQKILNDIVTNKGVDKKESRANTGFILGLCSIVAWFIPLFGYPVTITGIVFSAMGIDSNKKSSAITGLVLSIVFLIITLINSIGGVMLAMSL